LTAAPVRFAGESLHSASAILETRRELSRLEKSVEQGAVQAGPAFGLEMV
jgi:hypothetical protein